MPETLSPWGWRVPDLLGNDFFKTGFTAIRHLAADISASLTGITQTDEPSFPTLATNWSIGGDGARIARVGKIVNVSGHLLRASTNYVAGGTIFTMPAGYIPRQMQWSVALRFGNAQGELKIRPTKTPAGAADGAPGAVSMGIDIPAGSGIVFSHTFIADI